MEDDEELERTVVALFRAREDAERAIRGVVESGVSPERIGYLEPVDEQELKNPAKGAFEGAAIGGAAGAVIAGLLASVFTGLIPGLGFALVAGALGPVALSTIVGAATGSVAGGLMGADVMEEDDLYFMQEVQAGRVLVTVEVLEGEEELMRLLRESGAIEVDSLGTATLHARLRHPGVGEIRPAADSPQ